MTQNKTNKVSNVPPLRFPEFSGEWERMRVSDFLDFYSTNSLSWEQLEYGTGNLCNLHYGLIHVGLPTLINLSEHILPNIKLDNTPRNYELCQEGDVAFADASEDTNEVAKVVEFYELQGKDVVCGLHTIHGRDNKGLTIKGFKGYALSSVTFHNQIRRLAQGTKIYSVSTKNFAESYISLPSKEEQSKIVTLLSLLDKRIATQIRVIDKLESLIKGIYQKVFDRYNANYLPLAQLSTIQKGEQVNSEGFTETGDYYVMNGGITPSGYYNRYNSVADTISISEGGNSCGYVQYNTECFWSGGHCYTLLDIDSAISKLYLYHYLKYKEKDIMALRIGSGLPNIQKKDLSKFPILVLPLSEQQRVANLLQLIAEKIKVEKDNLSHLSQQKAYLLQNMFI